MSEGIELSRIKPVGRKVLIRKCKTAKPDLIEVPEQYLEQCEFAEIIAVGSRCKVFNSLLVGQLIQCPELGVVNGAHPLQEGSSEYWMCDESVFLPATFA